MGGPEAMQELLQIALVGASEGAGGYFNWGFFFKHLVNLILLLLVLGYFLRVPVRNFLLERRGLIAREIDEAQAKYDASKERHKEYSERMKNIDREIKSIGEDIRRGAEIERRELLEHADRTAKRIVEDARETLRLEGEKARQEIQEEAIALAVALSERLISEKMNRADEKGLIDQFVKITEEEKWHQ